MQAKSRYICEQNLGTYASVHFANSAIYHTTRFTHKCEVVRQRQAFNNRRMHASMDAINSSVRNSDKCESVQLNMQAYILWTAVHVTRQIPPTTAQ
jgi:hypothetical protein